MKRSATKILCAIIILIASFSSTAQVITTVTGNNIMGYYGDGGPATSCRLSGPLGITFDVSGNFLIADEGNNRIRKVNPAGVITTIAGIGGLGYNGDGIQATDAQLASPYSIISDAAGNIYIADASNLRVRKINSSGVISTVAGSGVVGFSGDGGMATDAKFGQITSIALDNTGNIFIADYTNSRVRKVNSTGIITTVAGNGLGIYSGDGGPATSASFGPNGIDVDNSGNIYIADQLNNRILKVNAAGIITSVAGTGSTGYNGDGIAATSAKLSKPTNVKADNYGNIYISDKENFRIRKVNSGGIITTVAGKNTMGYSGDFGPATACEIAIPNGITINSSGNLFFADQGNHVVRKINFSALATKDIVNVSPAIALFPNPNNGTFSLRGSLNSITDQPASVEVTNILGQVVYKKITIATDGILNEQIELKNAPGGIYFLHLTSENESSAIRFIIGN